MIETLRVSNLALIDALELELEPGLNVITGETGAGKSILLSAVAVLSGRRVSSEVVRTGESEARVEAIFALPFLIERAVALGLAEPGEEELLVVRTVSREGRGKVFINGKLATVSVLAELMADVIEVASQGEHQRLLRPEVQTELLDQHGDLGPAAEQVAEDYRAWRTIADQLRDRRQNAAERARREDHLRAEVAQIDHANLEPGELDELEREHARLAHVDRLEQGTAVVLDRLENDGGICAALAASRARLRDLVGLDSALAPIDAALERAALEAEDALRELESYRGDLEPEPGRLDFVESRLAEIRRLEARFGETVEAILAYRERAAAELEEVGGGEARTAELESALARARTRLAESAAVLSAGRAAAALDLGQAVEAELRGLDMPKARFEARLEPASATAEAGELEPPCGPGGAERVGFWLAANPGEEARRLRDAASGGELARLLLALRNALRSDDAGRLLLFDEVDAGIGGRTAQRVGKRLRALAKSHVVLCITHLPQVAAQGAAHYQVHKRVHKGRTTTQVARLEGDARVDEIARMAGGGQITPVAREHARELLSS